MSKVYCSKCKYYSLTERGTDHCSSPENTYYIDSYDRKKLYHKLNPCEINEENSCPDYKPQWFVRFENWLFKGDK